MAEAVVHSELQWTSPQVLSKRPGSGEPVWLKNLRSEASDCFAEMGFPTRNHEEWKYTSVAPIAQTPFRPAWQQSASRPVQSAELDALKKLSGICLVFVNGQYNEALSSVQGLPAGVRAGSLASLFTTSDEIIAERFAKYADYRQHAFVALNTAQWQDGAYVWLPKGAVVKEPIHLLFISNAGDTPLVAHPRTLILAERESQASIIESYWGAGQGISFSNAVSEIVAGDNAVIDHTKLQLENDRSFHIATLQVYQERSSNFKSCSVTLGGALVRNEAHAVLDAEGAECVLNGLYLGREKQLVDNHTIIDHAQPHCPSRQHYNGILDGQSTGIFNGRIIVRPDAQKTDAIQKNRNLLLSDKAQVDSKPQLEIYANDVRCTHGATVGQIDAEALFYLRSRGISLKDARNMLVYAFAGEILERITSQKIRVLVDRVLHARLDAASRS